MLRLVDRGSIGNVIDRWYAVICLDTPGTDRGVYWVSLAGKRVWYVLFQIDCDAIGSESNRKLSGLKVIFQSSTGF
jgi:hypothetical protein